MASSINASTTAGVVTTADTSGVLNIQTAGTTAIAIDASQAVTMAGRTSNPTTISVGGATPSTSGAGITFPATQSASTDANTLDDYEEGTWTPNQGSGLVVVGAFSSSGTYTKIGRLVTATGILFGATSIATTATNSVTSNLPFTQATGHSGGTLINAATTSTTILYADSTTVYATSATTASTYIFFLVTYQV